jgi:transposase
MRSAAVRSRLDWKYALSLELTDPGFDHTVLSEFRSPLVSHSAQDRLLEIMVERFQERGWLKARGRARTDSTHVLAKVRALNRVEVVGETFRAALNALAVVAPDWLRAHARPDWVDRYDRPSKDERLPNNKAEQEALVERIGRDGTEFLSAIGSSDAPVWLREVPVGEALRRVWMQNYVPTERGVRWRTAQDGLPPAAAFLSSPYDTQAHSARKRTTTWVGYKVHLTQTCDDETPHLITHLITHVQTTPAPTADGVVTPLVHQALQRHHLLPTTQLVDTGYLDAELLAASQAEYRVDLLGPVRPDVKWHAQAGQGFDAQHVVIDWDRHQAICPERRASIRWTPAVDNRHTPVIKIKFSSTDCGRCLSRAHCIRSQRKYVRRTIIVRPKDHYLALQARRAHVRTPEYAAEYARRAGIEGTISEGIRAHGMRRSRYMGLQRTHLAHVLTAAAINLTHLGAWLTDSPRAQTRHSRFARLMAQAIA